MDRLARMHRRRTQRAAVGCLALLLQLAAGLEAPFDLNLCIAEDGHTVLELSHADGRCTQEVERHHPEWGALDPDEFAHHPCRDLSLRTSQCGPSSSHPRIRSLANVVANPAGAEAADAVARVSHFGEAAHAPAVLQRRTIVLLV